MGELSSLPSNTPHDPNYRWTRELTRYHWFVLIVAALGWLFDTMDQQLFVLARPQAMKELLAGTGLNPGEYAGYATAIFIIGWATGGLFFGVLGDRIGRAKTMMLTILVYSLFTGLSAFSFSFFDFAVYRFLTGLGVGGEFAVGVSLVAEVMPDRARPFALGLLQALSAVGNVTAALISISLGQLEEQGIVGGWQVFGVQLTAWRLMFLVGTLPALLAIVIRRNLKEPERWQEAKREGKTSGMGSYGELFGDPRWRKRAIVGMLLASSGVIGLWGIGFFIYDLNRSVFRKHYEQQARDAGAVEQDAQFVRLAVASPESLEGVKIEFRPADLIGPAEAPKTPEMLYQAVVELRDQKQPVSAAAVLDHLDQPNEKLKRRAQTTEERAQREEFLAGPAAEASQLPAIAQKIVGRTNEINGSLTRWGGITSLMLNLAAFFGIYTFSRVTHYVGRRPAFAMSFIAALLSTVLVFWTLDASTFTVAGRPLFLHVFTTIPLMGFCQLSLFGGYAIYFPELFPTRLRSTGTSFCYNVGRFVAAIGPFSLGALVGGAFQHTAEPLRWAGLSMCSIFILGLLVLPFAPETKGQPLPE